MKYTLSILIFAGLIFPLAVSANFTYTCEELEGALNLSYDNEKETYTYDVSSGYHSGGPLYKIRKGELPAWNYLVPIYNAFSIDKSESYSIMVPDHWCIHDGIFTVSWDENLDCGCETIPRKNYIFWDKEKDNDKKFTGVFSDIELNEAMYIRYLNRDHLISTAAYGNSCLINDAALWFRFDYSSKNSNDPIPPRLAFKRESSESYDDYYVLYSCGKDTQVYKIWSECNDENDNEVFFENSEEPMVISEEADHKLSFDHFDHCTVYALTDDPFRNIISISPSHRENIESQTGFEHPILEQIGADVKISASSDGWWSSSSIYRARKINDKRYEVTTVLKPGIDECVPAGEYIYFVLNHNCFDSEAKCYNYEEITVEENDENFTCSVPKYQAIVLEHELQPILIDKPFLMQDAPPSYNNYLHSCSILPGEILKRYNEFQIIIPPRLAYNINGNELNVRNCGEDELLINEIKTECIDTRKSKTVSFGGSSFDKLGSNEDTAVSLTEYPDNCYHDCVLSILSNDPDRETYSTQFKTGVDPIEKGTVVTVNTEGEEDVMYLGKKAEMEITIENADCLEMVDPMVLLHLSVYYGEDDYYYEYLDINVDPDSIVLNKNGTDIKINNIEVDENDVMNITLSGTLHPLEKISLKYTASIDKWLEKDFFSDYSYFYSNLGHSIYYKHRENPGHISKRVKFINPALYEEEADDSDSENGSTSSGCSMVF